jgi:hypothetical protein
MEQALNMLVFSDAIGPAFGLFYGKRRIRRCGLLSSSAYYLNETGKDVFDQLCINYNQALCRTGVSPDMPSILAALPDDWEEFYLSGIPEDSELLQVSHPYRLRIVRNKRAPYVDLQKVRATQDYLDLLSSSVRWQIRRSHRIYEELYGPVRVVIASSPLEASSFFDEMVELHQKRWTEKNTPGAFANAYFQNFHRRIIERRLRVGEIQMARVSAGSTTIGCVYSFVHNGTVSFYQSGYRFEDDNRLKPGLVSHAEIIRFNAAAGNRIYDFLAGVPSRFKDDLATSNRKLIWAVAYKPKLKYLIESGIREWWRSHKNF